MRHLSANSVDRTGEKEKKKKACFCWLGSVARQSWGWGGWGGSVTLGDILIALSPISSSSRALELLLVGHQAWQIISWGRVHDQLATLLPVWHSAPPQHLPIHSSRGVSLSHASTETDALQMCPTAVRQTKRDPSPPFLLLLI